MRSVQCPKCQVELTIPDEAGTRRLRCPKCAERFYPSGRPASSAGSTTTASPESSVLLQPIDVARVVKRVTVPPSSGQHPTSRAPSGDLRDLLDIPLVDDGPSARPPSHMADAAALFGDEPPPSRTHRIKAEARMQARRCTSCQSIVPVGMSLCEHCGLDQDTGERYDVEEEYVDHAPPVPTASGPPFMVLMIGLVVLISSSLLALLALLQLDTIGQLCLTPVSLFGVYAAVQFLRGKNSNLLVVALMLGGAVDIITFIALPAILPEIMVTPEAPVAQDDAPPPKVAPPADAETDPDTTVATIPRSGKVDNTKLTLGIVVLFVDAAMLLCLTTPSVRQYFQRKHRTRDEGFVIIP